MTWDPPVSRFQAQATPETWACVLGPRRLSITHPAYSYVTRGHNSRHDAVVYASEMHPGSPLLGLIRFGIGPDGNGYAEWVNP